MIKESKIFFYILIRSWNSFEFFDQCIDSVFSQNYANYKILFIDDASEYTKDQKDHIRKKLFGHTIVFNKNRKFALKNAYLALHHLTENDKAIIFNLDGDDYLSDVNALLTIAKTYSIRNCDLTYGECFLKYSRWTLWQYFPARFALGGLNQRYPRKVEANNAYRNHTFLPLHPRTWKLSLFKQIKKKDFKNNKGEWLKTCEDQAIFFPLLEMSGGNYEVIKKPIYTHRYMHSKSDHSLNRKLQLFEEKIIRNKRKY